jgi:hypothetical protein
MRPSGILLFRTASKADPRRQLKSPRTARAEDLCEARGGLTECGTGEIAAVAGKVRGIEDVEHLVYQRQPPPLFKDERPTQPQIKRVKIVVKPVMLRQH